MPIRVLIVSSNVSLRMGGEASLAYYYAKLFTQFGAEVWLLCHERVADELLAGFPELKDRMRFVRDTEAQKFIFRMSRFLPERLRVIIGEQLIDFSAQLRMRKITSELVSKGKIDVLFEPSPISPKAVSYVYDSRIPLVVGPLCGGMSFPPAFADFDSAITRATVSVGRVISHLFNFLVPGKLKADILLAANAGTVKALPAGYRGRVIRLYESGVDLEIWKPAEAEPVREDGAVRFAFSGRFVDWKGVQYLVPAFAKAVAQEPRCRLDLVGGGELEGEVKALIKEHKLADLVTLHGWKSRPDAAKIVRQADVFVMPSLRECGGTAILEAMALGKPVISVNWGGPADYINPSCGILVEPASKSGYIDGLAEAMVRLGRSPELRRSLGEGGKARVRQDDLDWHSKAARVLSILQETVDARKVKRAS